jgi:release factor glutamine methyltransferase
LSTLREFFTQQISLFQKSAQPALEAQLLICHSLGISKEQFFLCLERTLSKAEERRFERLAARRLAGCPLPYLTGVKEFWSMAFRVGPGVLIPRPETESIVEKALALASKRKATIVDIGTGCGNIALALARELPRANVLATDISFRALKVARANAKTLGLDRVAFLQGDLFSPLRKLHLENRCDFILSNPPYVSAREWDRLPQEIREHEPRRALLAGNSGLEVISRIVPGALFFLRPRAYLLLEIGKGQLPRILRLFDQRWADLAHIPDLRGIPRIVIARKK